MKFEFLENFGHIWTFLDAEIFIKIVASKILAPKNGQKIVWNWDFNIVDLIFVYLLNFCKVELDKSIYFGHRILDRDKFFDYLSDFSLLKAIKNGFFEFTVFSHRFLGRFRTSQFRSHFSNVKMCGTDNQNNRDGKSAVWRYSATNSFKYGVLSELVLKMNLLIK